MSNTDEKGRELECKCTGLGAHSCPAHRKPKGIWRYDEKTGKLVPKAKAAPEQIRKDLAALPGEFTTKDDQDPDRIHELDPPHIVDALKEEQLKAPVEESARQKAKAKFASTVPAEVPVPFKQCGDLQFQIDVIRFRIISAIINSMVMLAERGCEPVENDFRIRYVWFPNANNINEYEMREGNPPPDSERPSHLWRLDLVLDVTQIPPRVDDLLKKAGIMLPDVTDMLPNQKVVTLT